MIWTFHRRLWVVALVHTFIGEAGPFLFAITNYFQPFVMTVANASIHDHYGVYLNERSYAWTWSTLSALDVVGNFVGVPMIPLSPPTFQARSPSDKC